MNAAIPPGVVRKILIVDDDQATRSGLKRLFERANYEVMTVGTFADGRLALAESAPDLLIADVRLGDFNGLQLVVTNPRRIPTIVVTGFADPVLEADARRLGADYLLKPVSPSALMALVKERLGDVGTTVAHNPGRRWTRKSVSGDLSARVDDTPARILDISYGGLRLEIERSVGQPLPPAFNVVLPLAGVTVPVDLVWTTQHGDAASICGASIAAGHEEIARAWHLLVDALIGLSPNFR